LPSVCLQFAMLLDVVFVSSFIILKKNVSEVLCCANRIQSFFSLQ
jgi:hypothetical protein